MNPALIATIFQGIQLLGTIVIPDIVTALKIKHTMESLGPEFKVNVQSLTDATEQANQDTLDKVNTWLTANGFDPLPPDPLAIK